MNDFPPDYPERVYAGVLGKLIGVYLGRPIEGWSYERIERELGDIEYYVNERLDPAKYDTGLVVTDDDISGTFVFPRALADFGYPRRLTSEQIGRTWLNYIVEGRSVLWWGGVGVATEHTAYVRLRNGIAAPQSGSAALNGAALAEQIGGQIFVDGWALISPGDPQQAADLAEQAARVSHDGVAVHAARLIAAMEAEAFVAADIDRLLDTGLRFVPRDSPLGRVVDEIRNWHAGDPSRTWRSTRSRVAAEYGYDKYAGACPVIPNLALIVMALLYGGGEFQRSLGIVCGSGWDTDCNAGNLGCLLGIRGGLAAIDAGPNWRGPLADRMYLPSADGGGAVTDAVREAQALCGAAYAMADLRPPALDKEGARFSFAFPGSVQGFCPQPLGGGCCSTKLANVAGRSRHCGRSLAISLGGIGSGRAARIATPTFFSPDELGMRTYGLIGCPTLYSGQVVEIGLEADPANQATLRTRPYCTCFGANDRIEFVPGPAVSLAPGAGALLAWRVPDSGGQPIYQIGLEFSSTGADYMEARAYLDFVRWSGAPDTVLRRPGRSGRMWRHAWVDAADEFAEHSGALSISHGVGLGMLIQGTREWREYEVAAELTPSSARTWGLALCVRGLRRFYAVVFDQAGGKAGARGDRARMIEMRDRETTLAEAAFFWVAGGCYRLRLSAFADTISASIDDRLLFEISELTYSSLCGGIALLCEAGSLSSNSVTIRPVSRQPGKTLAAPGRVE